MVLNYLNIIMSVVLNILGKFISLLENEVSPG